MGKKLGFRDKIRRVLSVKEAPHVLAMSFSLGVFLGISPLIGLHTLLGLFLAWAFRLNKVVVLGGVFVTNPWSIIPIYTFCTWLGLHLLGTESAVPAIDWKTVNMSSILVDLGRYVAPFVVGTTVVALAVAVLSYFVIRMAAERIQAARKDTGV